MGIISYVTMERGITMSWKDTISQTGLTANMARAIDSVMDNGQEMTVASLEKSLNDRGFRRLTRKGIAKYMNVLKSEGVAQEIRTGAYLDKIAYRKVK